MFCLIRYTSVLTMAIRFSRWACALSIAGGLVSCNPWTVLSQQESGQSPINLARTQNSTPAAIANLTNLEQGSRVTIQGTVSQTAPFLNGGAYEVTDSTGRIWVITNAPLPKQGSKLQIAGQLEFHDLQLSNNNFGEFFIRENTTSAPTSETPALDVVETTPITVQATMPTPQVTPVPAATPTVNAPETAPMVIPPTTPQKLNLEPYLFPHKANRK